MGGKVVFALSVAGALSQCTTTICDSFDTYTGSLFGGNAYGPNKLNASVSNYPFSPINATIDASLFYSGPSSLRINCTAANSTTALLNLVPTTPWPQIYGRAMLYYSNTSGNDIPNGVHAWVFNSFGSNSYFLNNNVPNTNKTNGAISMNLIVRNQVCLNYHWATGEQNACSKGVPTGTPLITPNQWHCLQWLYDGPNNIAGIWVNGTQVVSVVGNSTNTAYNPTNPSMWRLADSPGWTKLQFGFQHYQTLTSPVDLHLDDFVLDTFPTCCPCTQGETYATCCPTSPTTRYPSPAPTSPTIPPSSKPSSSSPSSPPSSSPSASTIPVASSALVQAAPLVAMGALLLL